MNVSPYRRNLNLITLLCGDSDAARMELAQG